MRQLEREAVRVVEPERLLARDVAAARGDLLEQSHPTRERLPEALLLGREDAMDVVAVLLQLRIAGLHLLDHDVGEPRQVRRLEPDAAGLLHRPADYAAHDVAAPL